ETEDKETKEKDIKLPQTSVPTEVVADEVVYEKMYDSVERAATTATGLDAEHDRGITSKTQFMATLNKPSSIRTSSCSRPRRQETIRGAAAQTWSERVSKFSNDPSLLRVNALGSGEDRLKLAELMELWVSIANSITTAGEVVTTAGVEVSTAATTPIISMDDITLAKALAALKSAKPMRFARQKEEEANIALIAEWDDVQAKMDADLELAKRLQAEDQGELTIEERSKLFIEIMNARKKHFARLKAEEKRRKLPTKAQKRNQMCTYLKNIAGFTHKQLKNKSFEEKLDEQVEVKEDNDQEEAEMKMYMNITSHDEIEIDAIPLATIPPIIVDWKIIKEGKISSYHIIRHDGSSKRFSSMIQMLQNIKKEDLKTI
nr:hypothetical protein [Tanacetum cinerariifolium]